MAKLKRSTKEAYLDYYNTRKAKNKGVIPRDTWTQAQWTQATPEKRALAKAGIRYKRTKRMK